MKLSKKGIFKLADYKCAYGAYVAGLSEYAPDWPKFEPEDFKGVVVLTSKEAKELIDLLSHAEDQRTEPYSYDACDEWALKLTNALKEMK